jgi:hypothetical protein
MSWDHTDEADARAHDAAKRRAQSCRCGGDMPGFCPGPDRCPMCERDDEEASDEGECQ